MGWGKFKRRMKGLLPTSSSAATVIEDEVADPTQATNEIEAERPHRVPATIKEDASDMDRDQAEDKTFHMYFRRIIIFYLRKHIGSAQL